MPLQYVSQDTLTGWVANLAKTHQVIAPVRIGQELRLQPVSDDTTMCLTEGLPVNPVKDAVFPQTQVVLQYRANPNLQLMPAPAPQEPLVLFGIRACDVTSLAVLDKAFTHGQFVDQAYINRREQTTLVALACQQARPTCFCTSFGIDPTVAAGADILLFPLEDGFTVETRTERGAKLLEDLPSATQTATDAQFRAQEAARQKTLDSISLHVSVEGLADVLTEQFESPMWDEVSRKCLGCGVCTFTCPTCHCFDIQDETVGTAGKRLKCWDSCAFSDFTRMAGGHNPRPTKRERVRQRFLHKLCYFPHNNGQYACVGCGRCLRKCPVGMDITDIITRVQSNVAALPLVAR